MRTAFIDSLIECARQHPNVFLVVGDLGYSVVEAFAKEFPERFLNAGVAEQNMTGLAAGLASEGWHVFTYSIANFPTLRCYEQIRNDVCYHRLPVTVVAVGAGLAYGNLGYSHHGLQDIAVMRALPGLLVLSPADPGETGAAVRYLCENRGPSYLRIGKAGEPRLHENIAHLSPTPIEVCASDSGLAIAATGSVLSVAIEASRRLEQTGTGASVFSCPWLKPLDTENLAPLWRHRALITLEEHVLDGGFGELVTRLAPRHVSIASLAAREDELTKVGAQPYLRERLGIGCEAVLAAAARLGFPASKKRVIGK
jgi:transketolase